MNLQSLFLKEKSFDGFDESSVLELVLMTAGVNGDVSAMVNNLYDFCGSFKGILEARPEQLMQVPQMTEKAAILISMIIPLAKVWERCCMQNPKQINNLRDAKTFCKSLLKGERTERFFVICLNAHYQILGTRKIAEGSINEVSAYPRMIAETALNYNAHSVLLCHNHPGGSCSPTREDVASSLQLHRMLASLGITLLDHVIVAGNSAYSMMQNGDISAMRLV